MIDEEEFFAWLDGELEPEEAARVEAAVAADPHLLRKADEHRALQASLQGAFGSIATAPVPDRIARVTGSAASNVADLSARRPRQRIPFGAPQWAAMAATLALGVALGTTIRGGQSAPIEANGGKLYAASAVDQALDTQLASAAGGDVRIGLTFRDRGGVICRTFTEQASSGLACRDGNRWKLRGLFAAPEGQETSYRMAGSTDPRLMDMVDEAIAGEPVDAAKEKALRDGGWR